MDNFLDVLAKIIIGIALLGVIGLFCYMFNDIIKEIGIYHFLKGASLISFGYLSFIWAIFRICHL